MMKKIVFATVLLVLAVLLRGRAEELFNNQFQLNSQRHELKNNYSGKFRKVKNARADRNNPYGTQLIKNNYVDYPESLTQMQTYFYDNDYFRENQDRYRSRNFDRNWGVKPARTPQDMDKFARYLYGDERQTDNCKTNQKKCYTVDEMPLRWESRQNTLRAEQKLPSRLNWEIKNGNSEWF